MQRARGGVSFAGADIAKHEDSKGQAKNAKRLPKTCSRRGVTATQEAVSP